MELFKKLVFILFALLHGFLLPARAQQKDLDYFVAQAEQSSPLIKDFRNQLLMNKIDSMRNKAGYRPQITASSTGLYAPRINGYGFDEVMTNGQSLDALLNVNYALTGKALKNNQAQGLQLQKDSLNYAIGISALELKKAITEQYIQAYDSQQQVIFNRDVLNLLGKEEALLKKLTRSNVYRQTEYLTFLVTFKQQQLQCKQTELQFNADLAALNYLSGIKDTTTTVILTEPVFDVQALQQESSFFIKRFDIDSLKAINDKRAIELGYKPKVNVYVNGGYNSSLILQPYKNFGASVGFSLSVPIYDGHQKKMQKDRVNLQSQTTSAYRSFFLSQRDQQLNMLRQQIAASEYLNKQVIEQIKLSKGLVDVDSKLLGTGDVKVADFVIAINNYMAAHHAMRQSNINRIKLISQLNYWNH